MRYASPDTVYHLLEIDTDTVDPIVLDIIEGVEEGVAQAIDVYTGRTFGIEAEQVTRDIAYPHEDLTGISYTDRIYIEESGLFFFTNGIVTVAGGTDPYVTPCGLRNVTAVAVGGDWDGADWEDEEVVPVEDWNLAFPRHDGWYQGIQLPGTNYDSIRVTAEWEDLSYGEEVPPLIRETATSITVDEYRIRTQSPNGELGPPGLVTYIRNIWEHTPVKLALDGFKVRQVVV